LLVLGAQFSGDGNYYAGNGNYCGNIGKYEGNSLLRSMKTKF